MPSFKFVCSLQVCVFFVDNLSAEEEEGEEKKTKTEQYQ